MPTMLGTDIQLCNYMWSHSIHPSLNNAHWGTLVPDGHVVLILSFEASQKNQEEKKNIIITFAFNK